MSASFPCPVSSCLGAQISFGEKSATVVRESGGTAFVLTPSHSPGPVDVVVRVDGIDRRYPSAFTYVSPAEYDTVLLPSFTDATVPGAFGSLWKIDHGVFNANEITVLPGVDVMHVFQSCVTLCISSPEVPPRQVRPIPTADPYTFPPNWLLHVRRPVADALRYTMRVRDLSRQEETWGTELPVVRERDFLQRVQLFDVPLQPRFRQTLRIYAMPEGTACCNTLTVRFYAVDDGELLHTTTLPLRVPDAFYGGPEFPLQPETAEIDSLGGIAELTGEEQVRIEIEATPRRRLWAYVSVTNNETQHVTIVHPQ